MSTFTSEKIDRYNFATKAYLSSINKLITDIKQQNAKKSKRAYKNTEPLDPKITEFLNKYDIGLVNPTIANKNLNKLYEMLANYDANQVKNHQQYYSKIHKLAENINFEKLSEPDQKYAKFIFEQLFQPNNLDLTENLWQELHLNEKQNNNYHQEHRVASALGVYTTDDDLYNEQGQKQSVASNHPGSANYEFFDSVLGRNFYPLMTGVNVPYLYKAQQQEENAQSRQQLRMGTPVHQRFGRVFFNNGFVNFLHTKKPEGNLKDSQQKTHVIINLQKMNNLHEGGKDIKDPFPKNITRIAENRRTQKIHNYEKDYPWVAAITLPADSSYFQKNFNTAEATVTANTPESPYSILNELAFNITYNKNDFYLSDSVKQQIFPGYDPLTPRNNKDIIKQALEKEFISATKDILGHEDLTAKVAPDQRQALLFHFIKYNLTEKIILDGLNPSTYQINCKDAIDRGGVHMLWRHFVAMHKQGTPLKEDDFNRLLDMPAALVIGRPANHNRNLIWNSMQSYYNNLKPEQQKQLPWVENWLQRNDPQKCVELTLSEITAITNNKYPESKVTSASIIDSIKKFLGKPYNLKVATKDGLSLGLIKVDNQKQEHQQPLVKLYSHNSGLDEIFKDKFNQKNTSVNFNSEGLNQRTQNIINKTTKPKVNQNNTKSVKFTTDRQKPASENLDNAPEPDETNKSKPSNNRPKK